MVIPDASSDFSKGTILLAIAVGADREVYGSAVGKNHRSTSGHWQASGPDELVSRQPADHPFELQHAQGGHDLGGRQAGGKIRSSTPVGWLLRWPSKERSWSVRASSAGWRTGGSSARRNLADQRAELFEGVVDRLDQPGAVADQAMAAAAGQAVGRGRRRPRGSVPWHDGRWRASRSGAPLRPPRRPDRGRR